MGHYGEVSRESRDSFFAGEIKREASGTISRMHRCLVTKVLFFSDLLYLIHTCFNIFIAKVMLYMHSQKIVWCTFYLFKNKNFIINSADIISEVYFLFLDGWSVYFICFLGAYDKSNTTHTINCVPSPYLICCSVHQILARPNKL